MAFNFSFSTINAERDIKGLIDFIHLQDLGYPSYHAWVERAEHELISGYKGAIIARSGSGIVGNLIYQDHKSMKETLEIKNMRVHPELRMRGFGRFLLDQANYLARSYKMMICDLRSDQQGARKTLEKAGFRKIALIPLYDDTPDIVMVKEVIRQS